MSNSPKRLAVTAVYRWATLLAGLFLMTAETVAAQQPVAAQNASQGSPTSMNATDACESDAEVPHTSRSTVGSIRPCCDFTPSAMGIRSTWACARGRAPA